MTKSTYTTLGTPFSSLCGLRRFQFIVSLCAFMIVLLRVSSNIVVAGVPPKTSISKQCDSGPNLPNCVPGGGLEATSPPDGTNPSGHETDTPCGKIRGTNVNCGLVYMGADE